MATDQLDSAAEHYRRSRLLAARAIREADAVRDDDVALSRAVLIHQAAGAQLGVAGVRSMLTAQGISADADAALNATAFATEPSRALRMLRATTTDAAFARLVSTLVGDAQRAAEGAQIAATPTATGWARHLNPPSCSRCAILAGRIYRWSDGFRRHPGCDCIHVPTGAKSPADLTTDVDTMIERGQVHGLSKADMQAYRDGADLTQIVNVRRKAAGLTEAGETLIRGGRLTPAAIRVQAGADRARRLELLEINGYIAGSPRLRASASGGGRGAGGSRSTASAAAEPPRRIATVADDSRIVGVKRAVPGSTTTENAAVRASYDALSKSISANAWRHILDGDGRGGAHRYNQPMPAQNFVKTWFPKHWSDEKIRAAIRAVLASPRVVTRTGRDYAAWGDVDGVRLVVVVKPGGTVKTAYPVDGDMVVRARRVRGQIQLTAMEYGSHEGVRF
ncbi:EndoU domain-containing protein [Pimelobacter simplex]|uniref:VG15 protein n=1 Tax=Nocardioides simplex TaxID=2045 RepID=UPI00366CF107